MIFVEFLVLLLTYEQASAALQISKRTLFQKVKDGEVSAVKIGNRVLFDPADLRAWIDRMKSAEGRADG
jgi:excisionase family DNA binding protein